MRNLSQEQRRIILLRLLFHRFSNRQRRSVSRLTEGDITTPNGPLRILTHEEAMACNAVCRFCLGQVNEEEEEEMDNPYISPCNCSGGSEWVHMKCFRRWQLQACQTQSARVCTVCRCYFLLPPLSIRRECLRKGTILVCMDDDASRPSSFHKTLILLLDHTESSTCGFIINVSLLPQVPSVEEATTALPNCCIVSWRRGGPVCGGRLGITRYFVAHTLKHVSEVQYGSQRLVSCPIFLSEMDYQLQFVFDSSNLNFPATFRGEDLVDIIQCFTLECPQEEQCQFIIFSGYCKWRGGQLQGEIQRGTWGVCNAATVHHVLQPASWHDVRNDNHMQTHVDLLEEETNLDVQVNTRSVT